MIVIKTENLSKYYSTASSAFQSFRAELKAILSLDKKSKTMQDEATLSHFGAIKNINIEVQQGDSLAIIGKNGSGKSTLLKVLSRVTHPTSGKVFIKGRVISLLELGAGFNKEISGLQNIYLSGSIMGMSKKEIDEKVEEIINFSELEKFIHTPVKKYSSGMFLRLAFSVMFHLDGDIFIIDEALGVGDISFQKKCTKQLKKISASKEKTLIVVSHNLAVLKQLCSWAIVMEKGVITSRGNIEDILTSYYSSSLTDNKVALKERKDRHGNQYLTVTKITLSNSAGEPVSFIHSGDELIIRFHFVLQNNVDLSKLVVACAFGSATEEYLLSWISDEKPTVFQQLDKGIITFTIPSVALRASDYFFSYRIGINNLDTHNVCDQIESVFTLTVKKPKQTLGTSYSFHSALCEGHFS